MSNPVTISPNIQSGEPVFTNTRVPVKNLFDYLKAWHSLNEFLADFPSVKKEQAIQVIDHFENLLNFHVIANEKGAAWENLPQKLKYRLQDVCEIFTVNDKGWNALENGDLINAMQDDGFDFLLTSDKNLQYQQNLTKYSISFIVLNVPNNNYETILPLVPKIKTVLADNVQKKLVIIE